MGHETFSIDKNMRLTVINLLTLMRLIKITYFNRLTALYIYIYILYTTLLMKKKSL